MREVAQKYGFFIIIDFEATCIRGPDIIRPQEIIEFPAVLVDAATLEVVGEK